MHSLRTTAAMLARDSGTRTFSCASRRWLDGARKTVVVAALNMPLALSCCIFAWLLSAAGSPYLGTIGLLGGVLWLSLAVTVFVCAGAVYLFILAFFFASFSLGTLLAFVLALELGCSLAVAPEPEARIAGLFELLVLTIVTASLLISHDPRLT